MSYTSRIDTALKLATMLHEGQYRKDRIKIPYIVHPVAVMYILKKYTRDEDVLIAGLLHDVLEDALLPYDEKINIITSSFGDRVCSLVKSVSEDAVPESITDKKEAWEYRKNTFIERLRTEKEDSLLVCAADKIHNLMSLINAYEHEGAQIWERFHSPEGHKLWFYHEVFNVIKSKTRSAIVDEYEYILSEAHRCVA